MRLRAPSAPSSGDIHATWCVQVTESQRSDALACMDAFGTTYFREDLQRITVPTVVIHGEADVIVPIEGSAPRGAPQPVGKSK